MKKSAYQPKWAYGASALCLSLVLQACGGGDGAVIASAINTSANASAVASSATSQLAQGVVTGFGSVFVDGVELEDASAPVVKENYDGSLSNSVLQMGQRVRATHDGRGTATKVTIDAAVIGTVSGIDLTAGTLTVAGQKISTVSSSTTGTLTVWAGGLTSLSDVTTGTVVEVHGTPVYDSTAKVYTLTASRIQKVTDGTGRVQVAGTISALDTTAKTFSINGLTVNYTSAVLRPTTATLANGTVVTAYAPLTALTGTSLTASNLKVNQLQDSTLALSQAQIGGQVSKYDSTAKTFEVQGIKVSIGSGTTINPSTKTVADGAYVNVTGTIGSDGSFTATNVQIRAQSTSTDLATVKLVGVISDLVDSSSFVVRGVPVDASKISLSTACPGVTLANDLPVKITATQQANTAVVLASKLECKVQGAVVIRPMDGTASAVDTNTKTFTVTLANSSTTQAVQWNANTTFVGVTTETLASSTVRVEGYLSGNTLVARSISRSGSRAGAEREGQGERLDDEAFRASSAGVTNAWSAYKARKH